MFFIIKIYLILFIFITCLPSFGVNQKNKILIKASNKLSKANIANLIQSAEQDYKNENYKSAIEKYKNILNSENNNPGLYFLLGASYLGLNSYELASEYFLKAIELNPALLEAYFSLAYAYQGLNKNQEALAVYRKSLGFDFQKELPKSIFRNEVIVNNNENNSENNNENENQLETVENNEKYTNFSTLKIQNTNLNNNLNKLNDNNNLTLNESGQVIIKKDNNYYLEQIEESENELQNNPEDTQLIRRLAFLYLKINNINKVQEMLKLSEKLNSEFTNEIKTEINKFIKPN